MTTDTTYNGWTNYETWAVGMYLDGNYTGSGTYDRTVELVTGMLARPRGARRFEIADALKGWVRGEVELDEPSLAADLLGAALDSVNWDELAEAWIQSLKGLI